MVKQKEIFLQSEGDAWFNRNRKTVSSLKLPEGDPLLLELLDLLPENNESMKILEVGCGDGTRLAWLKSNLSADCYGVEPSALAVNSALAKGINAQQGTADSLPYENLSFDIVIFGFCLYLCDREDLFRIAAEADRVLRSPGWLLILDFFSPTPKAKTYHHCPNVLSFKMDYRRLFAWHPDYECIAHKIGNHSDASYTDNQDEWVAVSILRKFQKEIGA